MGADLRNRLLVLVATIVISILFLAPTFAPEKFGPGWISKPISLGLDLRGGVHLVYEVDLKEAAKGRLLTMGNALRSELRNENIALSRVAVNDKNELELTALSERLVDQIKKKTEEVRELSFVRREPDGEKIRLVYNLNPEQTKRIEIDSVNQAIETLRNRVDTFGVAEPLIQKSGEKRITLQMPGETDVEKVKNLVGRVAKLEFRLVPINDSGAAGVMLKSKEGPPIRVEDQALMTGAAVKSATVEPRDGQIHVSLAFTSEGAKTFARVTAENVGRKLAIILDNIVYSAPVINEAIWGGVADISGHFSPEEAQQLKTVLRSGALPAPLKVMEERTVGPSLGAESIRKGIMAMVVGFAFIVVFMCAYYGKSGIVAVGTLMLNLLYVVAILAGFGATLSLPGLAGLALTIGMAVDSNVIIFERIRDELRIGASRDAAVRAGFDKAWSAIVDSNLTSLLTGIILYWFGSGPIRGFAVSLSVGIITTVFCAIFVARLAFDSFQLTSKKGLSI